MAGFARTFKFVEDNKIEEVWVRRRVFEERVSVGALRVVQQRDRGRRGRLLYPNSTQGTPRVFDIFLSAFCTRVSTIYCLLKEC